MNNTKNKAQKTVLKLFFAWQDQKEERWLEEMAAQGWLLKKYTFLRYHFTAAERAEYIYRLDYKTTSDKDIAEYKEIFAQSGWEHVCSYMGWQYLRIPRDQFTVDIYSDKSSRIEKMRRLAAYALGILLPMFVIVVVIGFPGRAETAFERYHLTFLNFLFPILFILMIISLILNGIWLIKLSNRIKEMENET